MDDTLALALRALRDGRRDDAARLAWAVWQREQASRAAALLALLELDAGHLAAALEWTSRAAEREPGNAALHLQRGRVCAQLQRHRDARAALTVATQLAPESGPAWLELGRACARCGEVDEALRAPHTAARFPEARDDALQSLAETLPLDPAAVGSAWVPAHARTPLSIVICSVDDGRFARAAASYGTALADWPHEVVRITDALSLAEGYTRGLAPTRHLRVIFSHDDVEVLAPDSPDFGACDIVGIAGAERVAGPAWCHAGHPWLHGLVVYPHPPGLAVHVYSAHGPLVPGLRVLDGMFLAMRTDIARRVGWDAQTFTGFHGYDVDFTLRAASMGLAVGAATDLALMHHSTGQFGDAWRDAAARLQRKHPALAATPSPATHAFVRTLPDRVAAAAFAARWRFTAFVASCDAFLAQIGGQMTIA